EGDKVQINCFADDRSEAQKIASTIKNEIANKKILPSQIAILVRAGYLTRQFEESLMQNAVPYVVIGGMKFYDRLEIKDSIAYLRFCSNLADDLALLRIINVPKRGVGEASIENLRNIAKLENISLYNAIKKSLENGLIKGKAKENLAFLVAVIKKNHQNINQNSLSNLARELLNEVGYIQMWRAENNFEAQGRVENIEEFVNSLDDFADINEFFEYISLVEVKDNKNQNDAINIMTIHSAKGLEFEMVFLPGLEEGIFPSKKSSEEKNGIEEERRLMYVAITRAKKKLSISFAKTRFTFGDFQSAEPSRFIKEIPENEINFENIYNYENNYSNYKKYDDDDDFNQIEEQKNQTFKKNNFSNYGKKNQELKPRILINNLTNFKNNSV
ncbi:MAG: ATP-dependent helicase, partial [Alphaproteobacteria bacterium]